MNLLRLLQSQIKKRAVGTLALGERSGFKEIFFEKDLVYLCEDQFSGKIDLASLADAATPGNAIGADDLDAVLASSDLHEVLLPNVLFQRGHIDKAALEKLIPAHIHEDLLEILYYAADSFHFQEGRVPDQLLSNQGVTSRTPVHLEALVVDLEIRIKDMDHLLGFLPSEDEVFVLTAEGMAHKQKNLQDVGLQRIFSLIDGFRNLRSLKECSRLLDHYVLKRLVEFLNNDFLKKQVLPEIKGIDPDRLNNEQARKHLPYFKNAVKHAVDSMDARDRLAKLYEKLGNIENAVVQYNFIGDALYTMKKQAKAIAAYQHALDIKPDDAMVTDKVVRIYQDAADEELKKGETNNAIQLLEKALHTRPDDTHVFRRLSELLTEQNMHRELTELCDKVVAHAKKVANPQIGVAACRQVLAYDPDNPLFQKKLVNVYLDSEHLEHAAEEMAVLAKIFLKRGQTERALETLEKVKRLRSTNPQVARIYRKMARVLGVARGLHSRHAILIGLTMALLVVFGIYQFLSYSVWKDIRRTAVVYAQSAGEDEGRNGDGPPDGVERNPELRLDFDPDSAEAKNLLLAQRCESFLEQFPISYFRATAEGTARRARQTAESLRRMRLDHKAQVLEEAHAHALEGDVKAVQRTLLPLLELEDEDDIYRIRAQKLLLSAESIDSSAMDIFEKARSLESAGEWQEASRTYRRLLDEFPESTLTRKLTLPVLVETIPQGAALYGYTGPSRKTLLASTPAVLRLAPGEVMKIELTATDHHPLTAELFHVDGSSHRFVLERIQKGFIELPRVTSVTPAYDRDRLVVGTNSGMVQAIDISAQRAIWTFTRDAINQLVGDPLVTPEGIYLVWNDRQVILVDHEASSSSEGTTGANIKAHVQLDGLARTPAIALEDGTILVGTSGALQIFRRGDLSPVGKIVTEEEVPVSLSRIDRSSVVLRTASENLIAYDVPTQKIIWTKSLVQAPLLPPRRVGPSLVMVTGDRVLLIMHPDTGIPRFVHPLPVDHRVVVDPEGGHLLVLDGKGSIRSLALTNGHIRRSRSLHLKASSLIDLNGKVGVIHSDGQRLMVLDAESLKPRWALRTDPNVERLVTTRSHLVAVVARNKGDGEKTTRLLLYSGLEYPAASRNVEKTWTDEADGGGSESGEGEARSKGLDGE